MSQWVNRGICPLRGMSALPPRETEDRTFEIGRSVPGDIFRARPSFRGDLLDMLSERHHLW